MTRILDFLRERMLFFTNDKVKLQLLNALPFWTAALISGTVAVMYASLFSWAEEGTRQIMHWNKYAMLVVSPACFLAAWWMVVKWAPYAAGSGIPQVVAAIEHTKGNHTDKINGLLGLRILLVKIASSVVMVFGGGAVGREGPTIQISASIFKKVNDILPDWYPKISKRNMYVTGAAAGLAAAFNTPLGGIVFAIEELTKTHFSYFRSALLTGVIIAGLTALNFLGPYLYLGYPELDDFSLWLVLTVIPLAIVTGWAGSGMAMMILYLLKKKRGVMYIIGSGLVIAGLGVFVDSAAMGSGKEIMIETLFTDDKHLEWYMPFLRIGASVLSFSVGAAGGIFAPSLASGASIGAVFADLLNLTATETNLIILCGMAGFLTSITRSPFTSSIIVLEMTNSHSVIFFIMLTALLANVVSASISPRSFYDQLKDRYL